MTDKKVTKKVEIWTATAPFVFEGETYEEGDEFALPAGMEWDEAQTALNQGHPTFKRVKLLGPADNRREYVTHEILPVKRPGEGDNA